MKKLSAKVYQAISRGVNMIGTFNPSEISFIFEEDLTVKQYDAVIPFLQWCHDNDKPFGRGNYNERYQEFLAANC